MLHHRKPAPGPSGANSVDLDARRPPDRHLSAKNVTCHQGPKLGPSERGYMQITEFEPLSHHRKLPNLGLHRMRDTKRLFGGPPGTRVTSCSGDPETFRECRSGSSLSCQQHLWLGSILHPNHTHLIQVIEALQALICSYTYGEYICSGALTCSKQY